MSMLQDAKLAMMGVTHLDKDALHIHIGLAIFFTAALVLRWPIRGGRPVWRRWRSRSAARSGTSSTPPA